MQKLQLAIPEPCHENWQQMTPTEQGRFCNSCAKEVIDFSMMTDTEVLNYFTKISQEKVCGRALPSQLERTMVMPLEPKKRLFWYWNYIVMFLMFFGKGNAARAQGGIKPVTEMNPVKLNDVRGEIARVNIGKTGSRKIAGKITDINGNAVSFASVKIKGTSIAIHADANGSYSLVVKANAILIIACFGFIVSEIPTGNQSVFNTILETDSVAISNTAGWIKGHKHNRSRAIAGTVETVNYIKSAVIFEVKDDNTDQLIDKAIVTIVREGGHTFYKSISDKNGICEFKYFNLNGGYFVKVEAEGYEPSEFTVDTKDFEDRKNPLEVLLKNKKSASGTGRYRTAQNSKGDFQDIINVIGQTRLTPVTNDSLYVIDGLIATKTKADKLNPDDISEITRLGKSESAALFGIEGSNGAIVITTRKAKEISLKEVLVNSGELITCTRMAGGISYTNIYQDSLLGETIATVKTVLTNSIKIYPNPVQRNTGFSVALKLKQAGNYSLQITDAAGKIFLLQKFNASAKDHTEKITADSRWAAGIYYIRIFDAQNKLVSKSSFVFQ